MLELTSGAILRQIIQTELSCAAHKLATLILDGIAWTDGYNGLRRGTAGFTLANLAERTGVSRQHLHRLLAELAASAMRLLRERGRGRSAPWLFRFACCDEPDPNGEMSATGDKSLYKEDSHKNVFVGTIMVGSSRPSTDSRWLKLIDQAKTALPCQSADSQHVWDRFREFNRRRGHDVVPAGYLLGFMRKWRMAGSGHGAPSPGPARDPISAEQQALQRIIAQAPTANRQFHETDLRRAIGDVRYVARLRDLTDRFGCSEFQGKLALHGMAVAAQEITR